MGSNHIVLFSPLFDEDFGFLQGVEGLAVDQFITDLAVETLDLPVSQELPGSINRIFASSSLSQGWICRLVKSLPLSEHRWTGTPRIQDNSVRQEGQHILSFRVVPYREGQSISSVFVTDVDGEEVVSFVGAAGHKVVTE